MRHKALIVAHLAMVNEVGRKILSTPDINSLYTAILKIIQKEFDFHHISLWIYDKESQSAVLKAKGGSELYRYTIGESIPIHRGIIGWCLKRGKTILVDDVTQDPHYYHYPGLNTQSELCAIIKYQDEIIGALNIECDTKNSFEEEDIVFSETISDMVAIAIHSSHLYRKIKNLSKDLELKVEEKTEELQKACEKISHQQELLKKENSHLKSFINKKLPSSKIIGASKALHQLLNMVDRIAPTNVTVLIQGESGTGKELIARKLHENSKRDHGPYVTINCSALNENLLKSELFGHEKGAFTGAHAFKQGLVETAHGGTLFMDEIAEMGTGIQAKLLRFLQEGEFYRVGGKNPLKVNVRVLSATNRDLEKEVKEGRFREDLFYRLNTITLRVPPLRKRIEDVELLVQHFLKLNLWGESRIRSIHPDALNLLKQHDWPGNIRELQNVIERLKILSESHEITVEDVQNHIKFSQGSKPGNLPYSSIVALEELEKTHILKTLSHYQGNKTKAAHALGITIKTLYNKLNRYENLTTH